MTSTDQTSNEVSLIGAGARDTEAALATRPGRVRLERCKLGARALDLLAKNDALVSLEIISSSLSAKSATRLFESANWPALQRMDLRGNKVADALPRLAERPPPALRELRLGATGLRAAHIEALHAIRTIEIWVSGADDIGAAGVSAIARSAWPLVSITVYRQRVGAAGVAELAAHAPSSLRSLVLYEADVGLRALEHLAAASGLAYDELRFRYDPIDGKGFAKLVESAPAASLTQLQVSQCRLDDEAVRALAATNLPARLVELDLSTNPSVTARGVGHLAEREWPALRKLRIGGWVIGAEGMARLASARLPVIEDLDLTHARLDDAAIERLAAAPWLRSVKRLSLATNDVHRAGLAALAGSPHLGAIEELRVFQTPIAQLGLSIARESPLSRAKIVTTFTI